MRLEHEVWQGNVGVGIYSAVCRPAPHQHHLTREPFTNTSPHVPEPTLLYGHAPLPFLPSHPLQVTPILLSPPTTASSRRHHRPPSHHPALLRLIRWCVSISRPINMLPLPLTLQCSPQCPTCSARVRSYRSACSLHRSIPK